MRIKNLKQYYISNLTIIEDEEGGKYSDFSELKPIMANIYSATGKLQCEIYGERINYINNMLISGPYETICDGSKVIYQLKDFTLSEGDGVCYRRTDKPDYKIISIKSYSNHLLCEIEAIKNE